MSYINIAQPWGRKKPRSLRRSSVAWWHHASTFLLGDNLVGLANCHGSSDGMSQARVSQQVPVGDPTDPYDSICTIN
ncbi:hypothetical protein CDAR_64751 [Caerostris darwini]|uniref:Uncharacterized protein n=1 Tax=Caerostris darwini TaxID=1538125 RepID=A0AAV4UMA6_9ARAC|nr:hypothetical protein CDAR_64751 [Caerostris darwini]